MKKSDVQKTCEALQQECDQMIKGKGAAWHEDDDCIAKLNEWKAKAWLWVDTYPDQEEHRNSEAMAHVLAAESYLAEADAQGSKHECTQRVTADDGNFIKTLQSWEKNAENWQECMQMIEVYNEGRDRSKDLDTPIFNFLQKRGADLSQAKSNLLDAQSYLAESRVRLAPEHTDLAPYKFQLWHIKHEQLYLKLLQTTPDQVTPEQLREINELYYTSNSTIPHDIPSDKQEGFDENLDLVNGEIFNLATTQLQEASDAEQKVEAPFKLAQELISTGRLKEPRLHELRQSMEKAAKPQIAIFSQPQSIGATAKGIAFRNALKYWKNKHIRAAHKEYAEMMKKPNMTSAQEAGAREMRDHKFIKIKNLTRFDSSAIENAAKAYINSKPGWTHQRAAYERRLAALELFEPGNTKRKKQIQAKLGIAHQDEHSDRQQQASSIAQSGGDSPTSAARHPVHTDQPSNTRQPPPTSAREKPPPRSSPGQEPANRPNGPSI